MSGKVLGRRDGQNFITSTGPDVCKTPVGSSVVPVPYSSIAFLGSSNRTDGSVRINGKQAFMLNSRTPNSIGTEPGVQKGVAQAGHLGPAAVKRATGSVFMSGWAATKHQDPAVINMASPGGTEKKRR